MTDDDDELPRPRGRPTLPLAERQRRTRERDKEKKRARRARLVERSLSLTPTQAAKVDRHRERGGFRSTSALVAALIDRMPEPGRDLDEPKSPSPITLFLTIK